MGPRLGDTWPRKKSQPRSVSEEEVRKDPMSQESNRVCSFATVATLRLLPFGILALIGVAFISWQAIFDSSANANAGDKKVGNVVETPTVKPHPDFERMQGKWEIVTLVEGTTDHMIFSGDKFK